MNIDVLTLEQKILRYNRFAGGIDQIPPLSEMIGADELGAPDPAYHPVSWYFCGSMEEHVDRYAPEALARQFNQANPRRSLYLTLADSPNALTTAEVRRRLVAEHLIDDATPLSLEWPKQAGSEIFALAPTFLLHTVANPKEPIALLSCRLTADRKGQQILVTPTCIGAHFADRSSSLVPALATAMGYICGLELGHYVQAMLFDETRQWNLHQQIGRMRFRRPSPAARSASALQNIARSNFNLGFAFQSVIEESVLDAQVAVENGYADDEQRSRATLKLTFPDHCYE